MSEKQPIYRKDYTPTDFTFKAVKLQFDLYESATRVCSDIEVVRNPKGDAKQKALQLYGDEVTLESVSIDDRALTEDEFSVNDEGLLIHAAPDSFNLKVSTIINPAANTKLEGLYFTDNLFCTQCEPHGFRRMTFFLDRPDVLASHFTTTLTADKGQFPVLLANGNLIDQGDLDEERHFATWHDPHPKPSYLFALVAGDLLCHDDVFTTMSGRDVRLKIYVEPGQLEKTEHAMQCLKDSMRWDEKTYGREYDLDIFMIVAVRSFNMGAMENKGLNVFNSVYILADPESATDNDYEGIAKVVGHEYFHNWSGNRVTCRSWFELSLKEGFTVFRDQSFTGFVTDETTKRMKDVSALRSRQFPEDAGPMSHPIRPDSYIEMNNFYTATVYEKGAEVIRMQYNLLGADKFREGTDLYFSRYDGQAVTCDEFVGCMADVSGLDMTQFKLWYSQSGTPALTVTDTFDAAKKQYQLHITQNTAPTLNQAEKHALHIPVSTALFNAKGQIIADTEQVLNLTQAEQTFTFENVAEKPVPSLLRGFSAPVKCTYDYSDDDLIHLLKHETNGFNRWEASQQFSVRVVFNVMAQAAAGETLVLPKNYADTFLGVLASEKDDRMRATLLALPTEMYLYDLMKTIDVDNFHTAYRFVKKALAETMRGSLITTYKACTPTGAYQYAPADVSRRALRNTCLGYLSCLDDADSQALVSEQFNSSDNMTEGFAALCAMVHSDHPERDAAIQTFYDKWHDEALVLDKWFSVQVSADRDDALETVKTLMKHEKFNFKNPNTLRSVVGSFCMGNLAQFHDASGAGYAFLGDQLRRLNTANPLIAARLITPLTHWRRFDAKRSVLMKQQLVELSQLGNLSGDLFEVIEKSLA